MALRFAAARCAARSPIARALANKAIRKAANDNGQPLTVTRLDERTSAALRLFAGHGIRSAHIAADHARGAFDEGDENSGRWWLAICSTLDRRMASNLERALRLHVCT